MTMFETLAIGGILSTAAALIYIVVAKRTTGSVAVAAALSIGFAIYTGVTIGNEGADILWANHTDNFWGVQVWWDLLLSVSIALFFVAPRARAVGMNVPLWTILVAATASIALLAMIARLFWLENQASSAA